MKRKRRFALHGLALLALLIGFHSKGVGQTATLKLVQTVPMPGYTGDFGHFAVDLERGRLLLAGEDQGTLEVFDLKTMKHLESVKGFETPHRVLVRPGKSTLLLANSGPGMSEIVDATTYAIKGRVPLVPGAGSIGYDAARNWVYLVTGGKDVNMATSEVEKIDADTGKELGAIVTQSNHTKAMALEQQGSRVFVNLEDKSTVEVIDGKSMKELANWPVKLSQQNIAISFDENAHRLYLACRQPSAMVSMNSDTGEPIASLPGPGKSDDLPFDPAAHRLYMLGAEGFISVYDVSNPDKPVLVRNVPSEPGAKTGIFSPEEHRLYVAVSPGETKALGKVLVYEVQP